ncbi:DUF11 domain-containing protein [Aurantiacibacter luteus]|uniref:DUF11 domain-containing protein n=1 Tax=Aurantiacibacter luteus TaxID=1581420 RepID=A0A0G9MXR8_9SPHN|nr:DUF11 domain-containing protein [Aurantiacibacter luteus]KLE35582.1 hypothetical protein AAW00_03985 [Aurantiacibacter luteus]
MGSNRYLLGAVSAIALVGFAAPAMAQETSAGELITNRVTVDFRVGNVQQTAVEDSDTFVVDRKIDVVVAAVGASPNVSSGENQIVREFSVTNLSNATVGYQLTFQSTGDYVPENAVIFIDANSNGSFDAGEEVTFLDALAQDETVNVLVQFDVPADTPNGDTVNIILVANAYEANDPGSEIVASTGPDDPTTVQTVLADGIGVAGIDAEYAGDHADAHAVTINAAAMTVEKFSTVVWDPVNLTVDPKAIPGARVQYCIAVTNAAGAATATGVTVNDDLPVQVTFYPDAYGTTGDVVIDGTLSGGVCSGGTEVDGYTAADTTVNELLSDIPGGTTRTLYFTVEIK